MNLEFIEETQNKKMQNTETLSDIHRRIKQNSKLNIHRYDGSKKTAVLNFIEELSGWNFNRKSIKSEMRILMAYLSALRSKGEFGAAFGSCSCDCGKGM